jgi:hypothetical protein
MTMSETKKAARHLAGKATKGQDRFNEARKSLQKMQEEIAPYIKTRKVDRVSTAGKWRETSSLISELCDPTRKV